MSVLARSVIVSAVFVSACGPASTAEDPSAMNAPIVMVDHVDRDNATDMDPALPPPPWDTPGNLALHDDGTCWWQHQTPKAAQQLRCPTRPPPVWKRAPQPVFSPCHPGKRCQPPKGHAPPHHPSNEFDPRRQQQRRPWREK